MFQGIPAMMVAGGAPAAGGGPISPGIYDRGAGANGSSESSTTIAPVTMSAGSTGVLCITADNANGASSNFPDLFNDSSGNTWRIREHRFGTASVNNALEAAIYTGIIVSSLSGGNITFTYSAANVTAKAWTLSELVPNIDNIFIYAASLQSGLSGTTTPSVGPIVVSKDQVLFGVGVAESADNWTGDSGETNGDWSTKQSTSYNSGTLATSMAIISQYKTQTTAATGNTYNPTLSLTADCACMVMSMYEAPNKIRAITANSTSATTLVITPARQLDVGSMGVLIVAADNSGLLGTTTVMPATFDDSKGNHWTQRGGPCIRSVGTTPNSGAELGIYTAPIASQLTYTDNITITWDGGVSVPAKSALLFEFAKIASGTMTYIADGGGGFTGATTSPTITTSSITNGDYVIGAGAAETVDTWTGDGDTSNGLWSTKVSQGFGAGASAMSSTAQYKQVTGTATQTYDPTLSLSVDVAINWVQIREV